jgi:hypothetical protein
MNLPIPAVLQSLQEFYDDFNTKNVICPNEAEFRSYYLLTHMKDLTVFEQAESYHPSVFNSVWIQQALKLHALAQCNNEAQRTNKSAPPNGEASQNWASKFFKEVHKTRTPYLLACVVEMHFTSIRKAGLKAMNTSCEGKYPIPLDVIAKMYGFEDLQDAFDFCDYYGLKVDASNPTSPCVVFRMKNESGRIVFRGTELS